MERKGQKHADTQTHTLCWWCIKCCGWMFTLCWGGRGVSDVVWMFMYTCCVDVSDAVDQRPNPGIQPCDEDHQTTLVHEGTSLLLLLLHTQHQTASQSGQSVGHHHGKRDRQTAIIHRDLSLVLHTVSNCLSQSGQSAGHHSNQPVTIATLSLW